jgi:hypothetical protein
MAPYKEHCAECQAKLGNPWYVVHRWLDEARKHEGGHEFHRQLRHHEQGIEEVRKMWGDEAAQAARLHIETDFYGHVPKDEAGVRDWLQGVVHTPGLVLQAGILVPTGEESK